MFKNEKLVKMGRPVVFRDGKKVDMSSMSDQWIDGNILKEEMQYVAKMTEGLTTGTMSGDQEYIELKNKVVNDMINDKVISLKKKLCEKAKNKTNIYGHAQMVQDQALKRVQDYAAQVAKDNRIEIYLDELSGDYKINRSPVPISLRNSSTNRRASQWHTIDAKKLKEEIKGRGEGVGESRKNGPDATSERIMKDVEEKLKAQKLNKKSSKFVKTVLDAKKKKSKKTAPKKNENIYDRLELSKYETYESIPAGKKSWISIHARKQGKDPVKIKKQIRAKMLKVAGKKR